MDVIIENGLVFDGLGSPPRACHVGIQGDTVAALSENPLPRTQGTRVIDARGHWVMPGFIDFHTHYDAEVELAPSLSESVRHGVTTVVLGSCSLSLAVGTAEGGLALLDTESRQVVAQMHLDGPVEQLRTAEAHFRTLAENIPILCWMARPDGEVFWYNPRWYEYTGLGHLDLEHVLPDRWRRPLEDQSPLVVQRRIGDDVVPAGGIDGRVVRPATVSPADRTPRTTSPVRPVPPGRTSRHG